MVSHSNICIRDILRKSTESFAFGSVILVCEGEARESGDPYNREFAKILVNFEDTNKIQCLV